MNSCTQEESIENILSNENSYEVNQLISLGYDGESIVELDDYFLVEGDIVYPKDHDLFSKDNITTRQFHTHELVSICNVNSMTYFVDPSISVVGIDNWENAVYFAIDEMNALSNSHVEFVYSSNPNADIIIKSDNGQWPDNVIASAGFPSNDEPYHEVLINLDFNSDMIVSEEQKRYNMVHELGHCIGLRHTNWKEEGEGEDPDGANLISGTPESDAYSVMNGSTALNTWIGFSDYDIVAIETLYPTYPTHDIWTLAGDGDKGWHIGDFDGDFIDDIFRYNGGNCGAEVFLSTGNAFVFDNCWTLAGDGDKGWHIGDFDGDDKDDIFRYVGGTCGAEVFISTGTGFEYNGCWTLAGDGDKGWHIGDYNGDDKDDIFRYKTCYYGADVFLSNGSSF